MDPGQADGSTGTNYSSSHHLIDMDAGILGASHKRTVQGVNLQKGFYIIQAKAYGYTGGAYRMEVYSAEGGSPIRYDAVGGSSNFTRRFIFK